MIEQIMFLSRRKILQESVALATHQNPLCCYRRPISNRTYNKLLTSRSVVHQVYSYGNLQRCSSALGVSCTFNNRNSVSNTCDSRMLPKQFSMTTGNSKLPLHSMVLSDYQVSCFSSLQQRTKHTVDEPKPGANSRSIILSAKSIVEASPMSVQPYLRLIRLDRPIGTWLTFLPSVWSISLASPAGQLPDWKLVSLFAFGAFFMRSAGCAINDIFDKDFDAQVARTKNRPIACGEISRLKAFVFLALPLSASLSILLTLNSNTIILGVFALLPVAIYPLMKRFTYWPQAFLGLTFNYGALMGWCAVRGILEWPVLPLYISCIAWTLVYDTIYAFQDRNDDILAGVKSTAVRLGDSTKLWLTGFSAAMASGLTATGLMCHQTWPYYAGVSLMTLSLAHQIYSVNLSNTEDCANKFRSNRNIGIMFWLFIVAAGVATVTDDVDCLSRAESLSR